MRLKFATALAKLPEAFFNRSVCFVFKKESYVSLRLTLLGDN